MPRTDADLSLVATDDLVAELLSRYEVVGQFKKAEGGPRLGRRNGL